MSAETMHLTDEQLDDYADGVTSDAARVLVEAHLAACEQCRRALGGTREIIALAQRKRAAVTAPAELWPMVASSTIHLAAMRRRVLASMRGALIVGALALMAATAVVTWKVAGWSMAPRAVVTPVRVGGPGPGQHAGHAGHPATIRTAPEPPRAPDAPRP
jgi:predicted anti-sigma-YlaC factor YlaD